MARLLLWNIMFRAYHKVCGRGKVERQVVGGKKEGIPKNLALLTKKKDI
jgi:hypothetical protein